MGTLVINPSTSAVWRFLELNESNITVLNIIDVADELPVKTAQTFS